jgi:hypothetical protein
MKDICSLLGYDFHKNHKHFFDNIIKRDFGSNILIELIDTKYMDIMLSVVDKYEISYYTKFLIEFYTLSGSANILVERGWILDLKLKNNVTVSELKLLGVEIEEIVDKCTGNTIILKEDIFINHTFQVVWCDGDKYLQFYERLSDVKKVKVTLKIIVNLIFFLNINTIFEMVKN